MTMVPPMVTVFGVMSPIALPATIVYGTETTGWRGVISGSEPIFKPK